MVNERLNANLWNDLASFLCGVGNLKLYYSWFFPLLLIGGRDNFRYETNRHLPTLVITILSLKLDALRPCF